MTILRRYFPPLGLLGAIASAFAAGWFAMPSQKVSTVRADIALPLDENDSKANPIPMVSAAELNAQIAALSESPLFSEGRRVPSQPEVVEAEEPEPAPEMVEEEPASEEAPRPSVQLVGIMSLSGKTRALVRIETEGTEAWMSEGDDIQGWTVVAISQNELRLELGGNEMAVQLYQE
jgi:type II secretory pathway component PulC